MAERKVLTRTESQALTREALLDAGEKLLLKDGYYATSLAAIANEAGRTIGAVYSNYSSKEELGLAVLKRRTSDEIASLMSALVASDDDLDSRLNVIASHWISLCKDENMFLLAAEYGVSITRQPHQRQRTMEVVERTVANSIAQYRQSSQLGSAWQPYRLWEPYRQRNRHYFSPEA
jgi:AcrR family transcriptional regulator